MKANEVFVTTNYRRVMSEEGPYEAVDGEILIASVLDGNCIYRYMSNAIYYDTDEAARAALNLDLNEDDWQHISTDNLHRDYEGEALLEAYLERNGLL